MTQCLPSSELSPASFVPLQPHQIHHTLEAWVQEVRTLIGMSFLCADLTTQNGMREARSRSAERTQFSLVGSTRWVGIFY